MKNLNKYNFDEIIDMIDENEIIITDKEIYELIKYKPIENWNEKYFNSFGISLRNNHDDSLKSINEVLKDLIIKWHSLDNGINGDTIKYYITYTTVEMLDCSKFIFLMNKCMIK